MKRLEWQFYGSVREAITTIVGDHYGLYGRALPLSTDLVGELGGDPLDHLEVLMIIEELFGIRLEEAARESVRTLEDLVRVVEGMVEQP